MTRFTQRTSVLLLLAALPALGLIGCDGEEEPAAAERLQQGLDQADSATQDMREQAQSLQEEKAKLQAEVRAAAEKQVNLFTTQLEGFRNRITALPADQETAFTQRLAQLETQTNELRTAMENYTSQDTSTTTWDSIKTQLDELNAAYETFRDDLDAETPGTAS